MFKVPERFRVTRGDFGTAPNSGNNGVFEIPMLSGYVNCIASDGGGWEHVSVSMYSQAMPTWEVMCQVKNYFWGPEDCVVQYHPPKADYVNVHKACLHLWRPVDQLLPRPPKEFV